MGSGLDEVSIFEHMRKIKMDNIIFTLCTFLNHVKLVLLQLQLQQTFARIQYLAGNKQGNENA